MNKAALNIVFGVSLALTGFAAQAAVFFNSAPMLIPGSGTNGPATPYPATIAVFGLGFATDLNVTLSGLTHSFPVDLDILLVGPTGLNILLMSDTGGDTDVLGVTLVFDDDALAFLPAAAQIASGTYRPTNFDFSDGDVFPSPAPAGSYGESLSAFEGFDPNGLWQLFIFDDEGQDAGFLSNGFSLDIAAAPSMVPVPGSLALLALGITGLGLTRRRV